MHYIYSAFWHQLTMQSCLFEPGRPVIFTRSTSDRVYATMKGPSEKHKPRPSLSYSRRRDCISLGIFCSEDGGGGSTCTIVLSEITHVVLCPQLLIVNSRSLVHVTGKFVTKPMSYVAALHFVPK